MKQNNHNKEIIEFLSESNKIEGVYDDVSLKQAEYAWEYLMTQKEMTTGVILKTHKILMLRSNLYPNEKGYFRDVMVRIGGKPALKALRIREYLDNWIMNVNDLIQNGKKENEIFLERMTKEHHVKYEEIHPFIDGNGRTGRMFMNWERLQLKLPLMIIHEGKEQLEYYKWFK